MPLTVAMLGSDEVQYGSHTFGISAPWTQVAVRVSSPTGSGPPLGVKSMELFVPGHTLEMICTGIAVTTPLIVVRVATKLPFANALPAVLVTVQVEPEPETVTPVVFDVRTTSLTFAPVTVTVTACD